jgi:hypothetical protein
MTTVLAALLGVVVGGLLSGVVQMTVARQERQCAGRVATPLLQALP